MNVILHARKEDVNPKKIEISDVTGIVTDTSPSFNNAFCYKIFQEGFKVCSCCVRVSDYMLVCEV